MGMERTEGRETGRKRYCGLEKGKGRKCKVNGMGLERRAGQGREWVGREGRGGKGSDLQPV